MSSEYSNRCNIEKNSLNIHIRLKVVVSVILVVKPTTSKEYTLNWLIRHIGHVYSSYFNQDKSQTGMYNESEVLPIRQSGLSATNAEL